MKIKIIFNALGLISFLICIWLGVRLISIQGSYPFRDIFFRLIIIACVILLLVFLFILYKYWESFTNKKLAKDFLVNPFSKDPKSNLRLKKQLQEAFKFLKKACRKRGKRAFQLRSIPCFLAIGNAEAGKEIILQESGFNFPHLNFTNPLQLDGLGEVSLYQWWLAEEGFFFTSPLEEQDKEEWETILKILKKHRHSKPINAVIIVCSLLDFAARTEEEQASYCHQLNNRLFETYRCLQVSFPVYLLFTKCDQISGFQEFFQHLSLKEREQLWGITFNSDKEIQNYTQDFLTQFQALILRLNQLLPWKLSHARTQEEKDRIFLFPTQMQLLKPSILSLIKEIFSNPAATEEYHFQGLYFLSALQEGKAVNLFAASSKRLLEGDIPYWHYQESKKVSYFFKEAFSHILLLSGNLVKYSPQKAQFYKWSKRIIYSLLALAFTLNSLELYANYQFNKNRLTHVKNYLTLFKETPGKNSKNFDDIITTLFPLEKAISLYEQDKESWVVCLQRYFSCQINDDLEQILSNFLYYTFWPLIRDHVGNLIQISSEPEVLEKFLTVYLLFPHPQNMNKGLLKEIMAKEWKNQYKGSPEKQEKLMHYLNLALENPTALPIDTKITKQGQRNVQREDAVYRIYEDLVQYGENQYSLPYIPYLKIGRMASQIFYTQDPEYSVPQLYTLAGFKEIITQQTPLLAKEVIAKDQSIGVKNPTSNDASQLTQEVYEIYGQDYVEYWTNFIQSLDIRESGSLSEQIKILEILTKKDSPLIELIKLISSQTQDISFPDIIKNSFEFINVDTNADIPLLIVHITNLLDYAKQISYAPDPKKAAFEAAKKRFLGGDKLDPLSELKSQASILPEPFKSWFVNLGENTWNLILENAREYIEEYWKTQILQEFNKNILNKYPFNPEASEDVSLTEFTNFFAPEGLLNQFSDIYLKPFLQKTSPSSWQWKEVDNHTLGLKKNILQAFSLVLKIQETFFSGKSSTPHLEFTLSPQSLSANAKAVYFKIGDQLVKYRHEAPQLYSLKWPNKLEDQECKLEFQGFSDTQQNISYQGEWALFKVLNQSQVLPSSCASSIAYKWQLGEFTTVFEISSSSEGQQMNLKLFDTLRTLIK